MKTLKVGDSTIWGIADHVTKVSTGIYWCKTSSHGGVWLSIDRRLLMPAVLRKAAVGAWYEEDCDWCLVVTAFPECFKDDPQAGESAKETLKAWFPDTYEAWYDVKLKPGESFQRDKEVFMKANANNWIATAAYGSWHESVPEGMVGVCCYLGGHRDGTERRYMVTEERYDSRGPQSYVIQADDAEWADWESVVS